MTGISFVIQILVNIVIILSVTSYSMAQGENLLTDQFWTAVNQYGPAVVSLGTAVTFLSMGFSRVVIRGAEAKLTRAKSQALMSEQVLGNLSVVTKANEDKSNQLFELSQNQGDLMAQVATLTARVNQLEHIESKYQETLILLKTMTSERDKAREELKLCQSSAIDGSDNQIQSIEEEQS